jgi:hypothetical protein
VGNHGPLYGLHEIAVRTLYAEVKERANGTAQLLPGTPGTLVKRAGTGHEYWYRSYYPAPSKRSEHFVGTVSNAGAYEAMQARIAHSYWTVKQVAALSKFGYQVADKVVASVLVELHNGGAFKAGLVVAGTLAYLSWLNEFGATPLSPKTQEPLELARRQALKLAAKPSFLAQLQATQLPFAEAPGASSSSPPGRSWEKSSSCRNLTGMRRQFHFMTICSRVAAMPGYSREVTVFRPCCRMSREWFGTGSTQARVTARTSRWSRRI